MSGLTFVFTIAGYLAIAIFLVCSIARVWKYANTQSPSKIALTPAPAGAAVVVGRTAQGIKHTRLLFTETLSVKKFVVGLITLSPEAMPGDIIIRMKHTKHLGAAGQIACEA